MKKLIIAIFALVLFQSQSLKAEGFYTGAKASQLKIKFDTVEGVDLGKIYEEDYSLLDFHIGYGISNSFFELGYFDSSKESKNLGSITINGIALSATTNTSFDGWRLGYGYNYKVNDKFTLTPSINYYEVDIKANAVITVTSGSNTFAATADLGGSDHMMDAGLAAKYQVSDNANIGLAYLTTIDPLQDTDRISQVQISGAYQF
jgi:long-subunit fatty acid transport protein